jgi:hypothetical protein
MSVSFSTFRHAFLWCSSVGSPLSWKMVTFLVSDGLHLLFLDWGGGGSKERRRDFPAQHAFHSSTGKTPKEHHPMAWSYCFCIALVPPWDFIYTAPCPWDMTPVVTANVSRRLNFGFLVLLLLCVCYLEKYTKWTHIGDVVSFTRNHWHTQGRGGGGLPGCSQTRPPRAK